MSRGVSEICSDVVRCHRLGPRRRGARLVSGALLGVGLGVVIGYLGLVVEAAGLVALATVYRHRLSLWLRLGTRRHRYAWAEVLGLGAAFGLAAALVLRLDQPPLIVREPHLAGIPLALAIVGLALINAGTEEALWRVLVYGALAEVLTGPAAVVIQALGFGIAHRRGLPGGALGMVGAGVFGLALGALRLRQRPYWELVAIHTIVDGIMFALVWHWGWVRQAHFGP